MRHRMPPLTLEAMLEMLFDSGRAHFALRQEAQFLPKVSRRYVPQPKRRSSGGSVCNLTEGYSALKNFIIAMYICWSQFYLLSGNDQGISHCLCFNNRIKIRLP